VRRTRLRLCHGRHGREQPAQTGYPAALVRLLAPGRWPWLICCLSRLRLNSRGLAGLVTCASGSAAVANVDRRRLLHRCFKQQREGPLLRRSGLR